MSALSPAQPADMPTVEPMATPAQLPTTVPTRLPSPSPPQSPILNPISNSPSAPVTQLPESVEHDRATYCPTLATHAKRNPNLFVQPVRKITKLSDAQKASNQLRRKVVQEEHQQLIEEFENLLQQHSQEQEELAKKFGVKPEYLDKLKGTSKHFKVKRSVNIENAKIHKKSIEINGGREIGDRLRINELRQLVKDDPKLQNLSKAEEKELQEELLASREEKRLGARPSNRSAAQDYRHHISQINDSITALSQRTGVAAVCFFTRTNLEDTYEPNWICSENASNFTEDSLGRNMWDITRLFELWACTKAKVRNPDSFASLREQCSKLINGGLKTASKVMTAAMNYQNYDTQIIQRLSVKLVGWTHHELVSPYEIHGVDDLRTLHAALVCGACFWMRLSKGEVARHKADVEKREAAGEVVKRKRKERSDKGVPKGPRKKVGADGDSGEDEPEAGPSKKRKVDTHKKGKGKAATKNAKTQLPPSKEIITDTDSDSASE